MSEPSTIPSHKSFIIGNTQNFIVEVCCDAMDENISTTEATETGSEQVNSALTSLSASWTTDMPDPSEYKDDPALQAQMTAMMNTFNGFKTDPSSLTPSSIHSFISTYLNPNNEALINTMSSSFITSIILNLQTAYNNSGSKSNCPTDLAACNAINTLISSTSAEETQPEQTLSRTDNSLLQQCQSAITSLAGIGDLANECNSSIIALMAQQY